MKVRVAIFAATVAALAAGSASANVIYDNGPANGTVDAYSFLSGFFDIADTFTVTSADVARSVTFYTWGAATPTSLTWEISTLNPDANPGSIFASGTVSISSTVVGPANFGYTLYKDTISLPNVSLAAGSYYLDFSNGLEVGGGNIFWDDNNGPSSAYQNGVSVANDPSAFNPGTDSEAFTIFDTAVPEPATWALMLAGFAGLGAALRFRRARPAAA